MTPPTDSSSTALSIAEDQNGALTRSLVAGGFVMLLVLGLVLGQPLFACAAAAGSPGPGLEHVFDMDGRQVLQDEEHLGIVNGKLAAQIPYRDATSIGGLWSPPYVSSNFKLDVRANGEKLTTTHWTWRPFQVLREGKAGNAPVTVSAVTTLIHGKRAAVEALTFRNRGRNPVTLDLLSLGWLDAVQDWGFARPGSGTETTPVAEGPMLVLRQGKLAVVVGIDSSAWKWETSGNLGRASAELPGGRNQSVNIAVAIGTEAEARTTVQDLLQQPAAAAVAESNRDFAARVADLFSKLPTLASDNTQLVRWYNRSLVHFLMNRWDLPDFVLNPYYSTGSVNGGCVANYLWNFGEAWEILPLFDAPAARAHIKQFLKCDLLKHFYFTPITGQSGGVWYMINQEKVIGLTHFYVLLTGDTGFLREQVDGKSIRDHIVTQAMFGDDASKPVSLIDYGPSNSHLELRRRYAYNHVMPDLNARRYASYLRTATLCDLDGHPAPFLRERAAALKPLLKQELWDAQAKWFRFQDEKHQNGELRYTVQMFKPIGGGGLDPECEEGLISHLNDAEFLSAHGLHSLSKRDPAYDQIDIDNGGGGICTSFPPQIIERLYQSGHPDKAADVLSRLLWWADVMPYWGDSIAANCKDYRRDTPLQCTFDAVAPAQCILFGVFGIAALPNGDVTIKPNRLPFTKRLQLTGLKVRNLSLDLSVRARAASDDACAFEVRNARTGASLRAAIGKTIVVSAKDGSPRLQD